MAHKWLNAPQVKMQKVNEFTSLKIIKETEIDLQYVEKDDENILREHRILFETSEYETFETVIESDIGGGLVFWEFSCVYPDLSANGAALMFELTRGQFESEYRGDYVDEWLEKMATIHRSEADNPQAAEAARKSIASELRRFLPVFKDQVKRFEALIGGIGVPLRPNASSDFWFKTIEDSVVEFEELENRAQKADLLGTIEADFLDAFQVMRNRLEEVQARVCLKLVLEKFDFDSILMFRKVFEEIRSSADKTAKKFQHE